MRYELKGREINGNSILRAYLEEKGKRNKVREMLWKGKDII